MIKGWFGWLGAILLLIAAAGCTQKQTQTQISVSQAEVTSVEALQVVGVPGNLQARVRGNLLDGCSTLGKPVIDAKEQLIVVILSENQPVSNNCPPGPIPFEQTIALGDNFPPGSYTLSVNGVQSVITVSGEPTLPSATETPVSAPTNPLPVQSSPTPTQEPTESPTSSPQPTATPTNQPSPTPALPTPTVTPASNGNAGSQSPTTSDCINKAAFYSDVTIPDGTSFNPGEEFKKIWQVRNAGTCTWNGYSLVFQDGNLLNAANPIKITDAVAPGALAEVTIQMAAPQNPGNYYSDWFFSTANGTLFGLGATGDGALWAKIGVRSPIAVTGGSSCDFTTNADYENQILALINAARAQNGLNALTLNANISNAARSHSQDMACQNFVEHYGSDGSTWSTRIQREGVSFRSASENIYSGNPNFGGTPDGAFNWWMNSKIHRDNILDPKSTQVGIGYIHTDTSTYKGYYTLDFIQP